MAADGACAPYDCYQKLNVLDSVAHSNYNGLVSSLTKRIGDWHSLGETFYTVSYTWSHMLDNADGWQGTGLTQIPYYNHDQFYGNAAQDVRQRLVISGGWEIPFSHLWPTGPKKLTSGWRLFPIFTKQSGTPLDVLAGVSNSGYTSPGPSGAGDGNLVNKKSGGKRCSNIRSGHDSNHQRSQWEFLLQSEQFRAESRKLEHECDPCGGPADLWKLRQGFRLRTWLVELGLGAREEDGAFRERVNTAFRVEAFNVLNHAEFWVPGTNPNSSTFGLITQVNPSSPSRILQLALRLNF